MKNTSVEQAVVPYQLKHNWKLRKHHKEVPVGESLTVPDDSYSIKDLIKKYAAGLDPGVTKLASFSGEDEEVEYDDTDLAGAAREDIAHVHETMREHAERQKRLLEQMEERKKTASRKDVAVKTDDDQRDEDEEEENTRKSRKYEKPKKAPKEQID